MQTICVHTQDVTFVTAYNSVLFWARLVLENKDVRADLLKAHVQIHPESNGLLGLVTKTFHGKTFSSPVPIEWLADFCAMQALRRKSVSLSGTELQQQLSNERMLQIRALLQWSMCASSLSPINPLDERSTTLILVWVHAQAIYFLYCYSSG